MDRLVVVVIFIIVEIANIHGIDDETQIQTCKPGDMVQNECLQCFCTSKNIYKCTEKHCSKSDKEHAIQSLSNEIERPTCRPGVVYSTDTTTCICDKTGHWPHAKCEEVFQTLNDTNYSCEAGSYVILDCNVCHCGSDGKIEKDRCTQNVCDEVIPAPNARRYTSNVYGSCEVKNWYSLAPCQFCFCVNQNKLVCNTGNYYAKKLDLGSYHLNVCGKGLIYEAVALLPDANDLTLRFGNMKNNTTRPTTPKGTTSRHVKTQENKKMTLEIKTGKETAKTKDNQKDNEDSDDSTTESEEEIQGTTKKVRDIPITQLPYVEDAEDTSKESYYSDKKEPDSGMDIAEETKQATLKFTTQKMKRNPKPKEPKSVEILKDIGENLGKKLKMNLPEVLDRMFRMALRKSMLSLSSDVKCVPGTTKVLKCNNICFCMKNGKLLCTNNLCE